MKYMCSPGMGFPVHISDKWGNTSETGEVLYGVVHDSFWLDKTHTGPITPAWPPLSVQSWQIYKNINILVYNDILSIQHIHIFHNFCNELSKLDFLFCLRRIEKKDIFVMVNVHFLKAMSWKYWINCNTLY